MATIFLVILISLVICELWYFAVSPRFKTRRRGSEYYVPRFRASFDTWQPRWTPTRRWYAARELEQWQTKFDAMQREKDKV